FFCCLRHGPARVTTAVTGPRSRTSAPHSRPLRRLLLRAALPAVVREAVDHELGRDEDRGVDQSQEKRGCEAVVAALRAEEVDDREERRADDHRALRCTPP